MSVAGGRVAGKKKDGQCKVVKFSVSRKSNQHRKVLDGAIAKALQTLKRKVSEFGTVELGCLERVLAMTVGDARRWSWNEIGALFGVLKMTAHRVQSINSSLIVSALEGAMAKIMVIKSSKAKAFEHIDTDEVRSNAPFEALISNLGGSSVEPPKGPVQVQVQARTLLSSENNNFPITPNVQVTDADPEDAVQVADPAPKDASSTASPLPSVDVTRNSDGESDKDDALPDDLKGVEGTFSGEFDTQEVAAILSELPSSQPLV